MLKSIYRFQHLSGVFIKKFTFKRNVIYLVVIRLTCNQKCCLHVGIRVEIITISKGEKKVLKKILHLYFPPPE